MSYTMPDDDEPAWWRYDGTVAEDDLNSPTTAALRSVDRWLDTYVQLTSERAYLLDLGGTQARRRTQGQAMRRRLGFDDSVGPFSLCLAYAHIEAILDLRRQTRSVNVATASRLVVSPELEWPVARGRDWWSPDSAVGWALAENGWDQDIDVSSVGPRRWDRLSSAIAECYVDHVAPRARVLLQALGEDGWIRLPADA